MLKKELEAKIKDLETDRDYWRNLSDSKRSEITDLERKLKTKNAYLKQIRAEIIDNGFTLTKDSVRRQYKELEMFYERKRRRYDDAGLDRYSVKTDQTQDPTISISGDLFILKHLLFEGVKDE